MCECPGYIQNHAKPCDGCLAWRTKHRHPLDKPCGEHIGKLANSMGRELCHYCNEALIKVERAAARTQTPPPGQGAHSSPPQSPPGGQAAHSSPQQSPPPGQAAPPGAATSQLEQICARLDALEKACGRMEGMMVAMLNALGVDQQVAQALAQPPGLAQPAVALAQPVAQAAGQVQAQVLGQVVAVNNN